MFGSYKIGILPQFNNIAYILTALIARIMSAEEAKDASSCYCMQEIISDLRAPVFAEFFMEEGEERLVVVEQLGVASVYSRDGRRLRPLIDISDRVIISSHQGDSRGLLSLALHPTFNKTGRLFAYYIRQDGDKEYSYLSEFRTKNKMSDVPSERFLLRIYQPSKHNNGGPMFFGDDGYLYIFVGDGSGKTAISGSSQNASSLLGKVLRLDVTDGQEFNSETGAAMLYSTPTDNPFKGESNERDEIFALGIRNMWGCHQDSSRLGGTGRIFCAETGTKYFDEINEINLGANYGWPVWEASRCYKGGKSCVNIGHPHPNSGSIIFEFPHKDSTALVGGFVYRGKHFKEMSDKTIYTYGDVIQGTIHYLEEQEDQTWKSRDWSPCQVNLCPKTAQSVPGHHLLAWAQDLSGELYLLMTQDLVATKASGKVFRLVPALQPSSAYRPPFSCLLVLSCIVLTLVKLMT